MGQIVGGKRAYKSAECGVRHTSPLLRSILTLLLEMGFYTLFVTCLCTLLLPLLLIVTAMKLWEMYVISGSDPTCPSPLPPGTMGLPFLGETLQMVLQVTDDGNKLKTQFLPVFPVCSRLLLISYC